MNIDLDTEICVCNSLTVKEIAECIKKNNFTTLQEVLDNTEMPIGDKCEACHDEGYYNDGLNILMVLAMVKSGRV